MDGVFVSDDFLLLHDNDTVYYDEEFIKCKNVENIKKRNKRKSAILNRLITLPKVWGSINYSVYFFSCNLDHILYNERNLKDNLKFNQAAQFALKYKSDIHGFINFFSKNDFSINMSYEDSWNFIKLDKNSLKRYTNFNLYFTENAKNQKFLSNKPVKPFS